MTVHSLFKKAVSESALATIADGRRKAAVNEGIEDSAVGWLTRNNILPQLFSGNRNGLRVVSALKAGKAAPNWDRKYLTYPFVGINGYALEPAIEAKHGNVASYVGDNLKSMGGSGEVRAILERQVAEGTGIPGNAFLISPKAPISTYGSGKSRHGVSIFSAYNKKDMYSNGIYPYNVQQAFSVDADGNLFPDPDKRGGTVLCPAARNAQMAAAGLLKARWLTIGDLVGVLRNIGGRKELARQVTGADNMNFKSAEGSLLGVYISGNRNFERIPNGNPDYMDFDKFADENGFRSEDGSIDFMAVREWILFDAIDDEEIVEKLIAPYLLMTPMESTVCWERLADPSKYAADIAVFKALSSRGGSAESATASAADGNLDIEGDDVGESACAVFEPLPFETVNESAEGGTELDANELMSICAEYCRTHSPTFRMKPRERVEPLLRDDGRVKTKSGGVKRSFVRIITENTPLIETDYRFCPRGAEGLKASYSGVMDFSPLFEAYPDLLEKDAPSKIPFTRIVGYMVSFEYDPGIEEEYAKKARKGKVRNLGMLNYYSESPNARMFNEPTVFDVVYVRNGGNGFIFSGYATGPGGRGEPPASVKTLLAENGLLASSDGLHSVAAHGKSHVKVGYGYNSNVY